MIKHSLLPGALLICSLASGGAALADPLSREIDVDFFRSVPSRNLQGLATRSDGRLVAGPNFRELTGSAPAGLLWCLEPAAAGKWLLGTGPDGKIVEVTLNPADGTFSSREVAVLGDPQIFALKRLADGSVLAGTSPRGGLVLVRDGRVAARVGLPVDSIFDILLLSPPASPAGIALVATGNPGRIYRVDLAAFAAAGIGSEKTSDPKALAAAGITLFGEIRDRNVRRIAALGDGRIVAGSAPRGTVYAFAAPSGTRQEAPFILQENSGAEVTDLLPQPDGGFFAAVVFSGRTGVMPPNAPDKPRANPEGIPPPAQPEKFDGRGVLVQFPADGFPETLLTRAGGAFYRLARRKNVILIAGGEQGDFTGYDLDSRMALTFAGSSSARISGFAPVPGADGRFLAMRNNAPGLALVDFNEAGPRQAETSQVDLGTPARLGALRIDRLRDLDRRQLSVEMTASNGSDEIEGWAPWVRLDPADGAWGGESLRGRNVKLRLRLPAGTPGTLEVDRGALFYLPQNHRPELQEFHFVSPNYGLVPAPEPPPSVVTTLAQLLQAKDADKRKTAFLASQVVPERGAQIAFWTVNDLDGDNVVFDFSIRKDGDAAWTDLAVATHDTYVEFDTSHFPDGIYFTRLVAKETFPRPAADRLTVAFETDNLLVDHTPPELLEASARRAGGSILVSVHGRDALSLLDGIEVQFNNGAREEVEQPADGIRDGREKTFVLEVPEAEAAGATALDVTLYDAAGNGATRRLPMP